MAAIDPKRLSAVMNDKLITPAVLAERVGKSPDYIRNIVAGHRRLKRNPTLRHDIAVALGVPRDWIEVERPEPVDEVA